MKKILLSIAVIVVCYCSTYAQNSLPASGNVGIGTTTPTFPLTVAGTSQFRGLAYFTQSTPVNSLVIDATSSTLHKIYNNNSAIDISLGTNYSTNQFYLQSGGNVGIGTTTPLSKLDVNFSNGESKDMLIFSTPVNTSYSPIGGIRFAWFGTNYADIQMVRQGSSNDGLGLSFHTSTSNNSATTERMRINANGNVLIGQTTQHNTAYILDVAGNVRANQIVVNTSGADFVFDPSYKLSSLSSLKKYIDQNHHLPEIASAKQMQAEGLNVGENQIKLLQKVEELTLYLIGKDKENKDQAAQLKSQQEQINKLSKQLEILIKASEKH